MRSSRQRIGGIGLLFAFLAASPSLFASGTTRLSYQSSPGDVVGEGGSGQFFPNDDNQFKVVSVSPNGVRFTFVDDDESWTVEIEAPDGRPLIVGPYENATDFRFHSPTKPGLRVTRDGVGCDRATGRFDLRELDYLFGNIVSFALDVEQTCEGSSAPLVVEARYSASSSFPRPADQDFDGVPDSRDNCPKDRNPFQADDDFDLLGDACDKNFNNTFFSASSAEGDPLGQGEDILVRGIDGVFTAKHEGESSIVIGIDGDDDWTFELGAPEGETLGLGVYNGALPPDAKGPELLVSHSRRACPNPSGLFEIHEMELDKDGSIDELAFDFVQSCDGAPPLTGSLRYNASDFIMIRPKPDTVLTNDSVTFEWSDNVSAKTEFFIDVGTKKGLGDIFDSDSLGRLTEVNVDGLPTDGSPIWLRLWVRTIQGLRFEDFQFTAVTFNFIPAIVAPAPSSTLPGASVRFEWVANGLDVDLWRLQLGTRFGSGNIFDSGAVTTTYADATGLPTDGSTVFARLWFVNGGVWDLEDFVYTSDARGGTPELTLPTPETVLPGSDATFEWEPRGSIVSNWLLYVGTTPGAFDVFNSSALPAATTMQDVTGLPTDGSRVYVRLWFYSASWRFKDYEYDTPNFGGTPALESPPDGSVLAGSDVDFRWNRNGSVVAAWWFQVGSRAGSNDLYDSGVLAASAGGAVVTGLPTDGSRVYTRLYYITGGKWSFVENQFTAADIGGRPAVVQPPPGSTLTGEDIDFQWTAGGSTVSHWKLHIGSRQGAFDFLDSGPIGGQTTSLRVTNLPSDGSTVYVRLWYVAAGAWHFEDATYVASASGGPPSFVSPTRFATLDSGSVDFTWAENGSRVQAWRFLLGLTLGGNQLFDSGTTTATTANVSGLPEDGSRLFATLMYLTGTGWSTIEAQFSASNTLGTPHLTSPAPNSVLSGDAVTFDWTAAGSVVKSYWLNVGPAPGTNDIFNSGLLDPATTSLTVPGLPTDGSQVWVQLWYQRSDGRWIRVDEWYTAFGP